MFSVTNTGTNFRPLCTAKVRPTDSGKTVERRDQVLMTFFEPEACASSIFFMRWPSMNGPFLTLLAMVACLSLRLAVLDDHCVGALVVAGLLALGELSPRRTWVTSAARAALAATHRMVDGVLRYAPIVRAAAEPTA